MANKKAKKTMGKKELKKTKGGLLVSSTQPTINFGGQLKLEPNMVKLDYLK